MTARMDEKDINAMSSLALAHVGDGVYELMVRTMLAQKGVLRQNTMHRDTVHYVSAKSQAKAARAFLELLQEEEHAVYNRARNAHSHTAPQGCTPGEYHAATALEALFGVLYLRGNDERLKELFRICVEAIDAA